MEGKLIIISAPSGCGKSTIIGNIMNRGNIDLRFSVSATSRQPRDGEVHGVNYYFLTEEEFRQKIDAGEFIEFEEVYPGRFYGTLRSEIDRALAEGHNIVLDIDVKGGVNVEEMFGQKATSIFIMPPSVQALRERLEKRATDSPEVIEQRLGKAEFEISYAPRFKHVVVNDNLEEAIDRTEKIISDFINS